jgi:hypothetical protein
VRASGGLSGERKSADDVPLGLLSEVELLASVRAARTRPSPSTSFPTPSLAN